MKSFLKGMEELPRWIKIILALPIIDSIWVIYRICKSIVENHTLGVIFGVFLIPLGLPILWLVDIISISIKNKVYWLNC